MMEIENKLRSLGFELPDPPNPVGNHVGYVRAGNVLYIGGNTGRINGERKYTGKVGDSVTVEQAYEMARNCGLNHLAVIKAALGDLDQVDRMIKLLSYVNVAPGFVDVAKVTDGESDLLVQLWGERGQHTRASIGVYALGGNAPVEIEMTLQVRE